MAKTLSLEEAKNFVRVNIVSPGAIYTEMLRDVFQKSSGVAEISDEVLKDTMVTQLQPLRRLGMPHHIGKAVAFLV